MNYILYLIFTSFLTFSFFQANAQVCRVSVRTPEVPSQSKFDTIYEYDYVDEQPKFPGGERALMNFINRTREYPYEAYKRREQGRVLCSFVVNADGKITHITIIKGCYDTLNKEAVRIIKSMPPWSAGKIGDSDVAVRCILPIVFRL